MRDHEVRVVDVQLHRLEEVLYALLLRAVSIDEVFARSAQHDLPGDRYLRMFLEAYGALGLVAVVEYDGNTRFRDARLTALVDEVLERRISISSIPIASATDLQILRSHNAQVVDT